MAVAELVKEREGQEADVLPDELRAGVDRKIILNYLTYLAGIEENQAPVVFYRQAN